MSKINVDFLELDLNEFVKVIKDLTGGQLDNESKDAITEMIVEVRKTNKTILKSRIDLLRQAIAFFFDLDPTPYRTKHQYRRKLLCSTM